MTTREKTATTVEPEHQTEPEAGPEGSDDTERVTREDNLRLLAESRDNWRQQAEARGQVLELVGINLDDDGNFDPDQLEAWHETTKANRERATRDLLLEAGFDPESAEGELIAAKLDAAELAATPEAVAAFTAEKNWKPNAVRMVYSPGELEQVAASMRLDSMHRGTYSDDTDLTQAPELRGIAEARARGDYAEASRLQMKYEKKNRRG